MKDSSQDILWRLPVQTENKAPLSEQLDSLIQVAGRLGMRSAVVWLEKNHPVPYAFPISIKETKSS